MRAWSRRQVFAPLAAALLAAAPAGAAERAPSAAAQRQLFEQYCLSCHNYVDNAGGFALDQFDPARAHEQADAGERVLRKVRAGMMPPAGEPRPAARELAALATALENTIDLNARRRLDVPRLHRLNRAEYANAVRDLLGLELDSTQFLPADDVSRGFDNQAAALSLSPSLLEAYLSAAARIARLALGAPADPAQVTYRVPEDANQNYHVRGLPPGTRGGLLVTHAFPADGQYTLRVFAVNLGNMGNFRPFGEIRGEQLLVYVDGERVATLDWDRELGVERSLDDEGGGGQLRSIDITLPVTAGQHRIGVTFAATHYAPVLDVNRQFERSTLETGGIPGFTFFPHVGSLRIDGPAGARRASHTPARERVLVCRPADAAEEAGCARRIAGELARRAYRGKHTAADVEALLQFYSRAREQGGFEDGIEAVVQRVLADPKFLYRIEDPPPAGAGSWRIGDLDLAARLSFFLWSSIPDDTLLDLAARGRLRDTATLRAQVRRMLDDPRATALTTNFAGQWLALRSLAGHAPVVDQFPDFDDNLRQSFRRETELLFESLLREDRSVLDLLTADYTFLDERLARHYGIPGIRGSTFRRVQLDGAHAARRGLLGKGAVLTVSSQPGRTSPVIRGNWVLKNIIGVPAPPPPPDVPELEAGAADATGNTRQPSLRAQLTAHRENPACLGCHRLMDPIGFALESFDAIGRWRTHDAGNPIDVRDVMYDGVPVEGVDGVRAFLLRYQDTYLRTVAQNLLTYALGRGMEHDDMPTVRQVVANAAPRGHRLRDLVEQVVLTDIFRMNAAPPADPARIVAAREAAR